MKRILSALALFLISVSSLRAEAQVLYAATGSNNTNGSLYTINPATGASTLVGPILIGASPTGVTGLAFHPATGILFGVTSNFAGGISPHGLIRINPATGAATVMGVMANPVGDIAFDANGVLYGWSAPGQPGFVKGLFKIDLRTGAQTQVLPGDAAFPATGGNGLSFSNGVLYLAEDGAATIGTATGTLRTVDPTTGVSTVGPILTGAPLPGTAGKPGTIAALATDPNKVLFGVDSDNSGAGAAICDLVSIDPVTGAVTNHGALPDNTDALAFSTPVTQILYAATGSGGTPGTLYTVDPATAAATPVGPTAVNTATPGVCSAPPCLIGMTGLAFHPVTHVLYGVTGNASNGANAGDGDGSVPNPFTLTHVLVTIDPVTGDATYIGNLGNNNTVGDIAFDTSGTLYGWLAQTTNGLVTINLATGAPTTVGSAATFAQAGGRGLSFAGSNLYLTANGADNQNILGVTGELRTVDPATSLTTVVATLTGAPIQGNAAAINALASNLANSLFGVNTDSASPTATTNLIDIDPATGVVTDHGLLPINTDALAFSAVADLAIAKTHSGNFFQGQTGATYSITVSNVGAGASSGLVTVTDTVPTGLTATSIAGTGWSCTQPSGPCTRSDSLPSGGGGFAALTLTVNVANNAPATVTNSATVSGGGDANAANNTANDLTTVATGPDPAITKTHVGNFFQSQTGAAYTITVSNAGQTPTSGTVTVTDAVPAGLTATAIAGTGWACTQPSGPCTRSDALGGGASYPTLTLTVSVTNNAPATVTNTATVSGGGDVNPANDIANDLTTIATGPDLVVAKTHTGNFTQGQTGATYTITVTNSGQTPTSGLVTVTDALPTGLTATAIAGTGWACTQPSGPCTRSDALGGGSSYPALTLTVNVANNAAALVTNSATVSGGGDVNPANNTANDPTTIASGIDLAITKTHAGSFIQGQVGATYTITVSNAGTAPSSGLVTVTDALPAGLTAVGIAGTGWNCTQLSGPCTRSDVLGSGLSYPALTLTVNVASNAAALVTNSATVSGGGDVNPANNTASDPTTVLAPPDLTITKIHAGNFNQGQIGATYTITVGNAGGAATSGLVTVTDAVPAGLTATAIAGTGWSCTQPSGPCTRSDALASGLSYPVLTLTVNVSNAPPSTVTNTATVSGGGEVNVANDTATDLTTITGTLFFTVTPCRVLDTRDPAGPFGGPSFAPSATRLFTIAGTCNIPASAVAVSVNVTVTNQASQGFLQLYAGGTAAPPTAVLTFGPATTRGNNAFVALSSDGAGTLRIGNISVSSSDVILDVNGYFAPAPVP